MGTGLCWTKKKTREEIAELRKDASDLQRTEQHQQLQIEREIAAYKAATTPAARKRAVANCKMWQQKLNLTKDAQSLATGAIATHSDAESLVKMKEIAERANGVLTSTAGLGHRHLKGAADKTRSLNANMTKITETVGGVRADLKDDLADLTVDREAATAANDPSAVEDDETFMAALMQSQTLPTTNTPSSSVAIQVRTDTDTVDALEVQSRMRLLPAPPSKSTMTRADEPLRPELINAVEIALS